MVTRIANSLSSERISSASLLVASNSMNLYRGGYNVGVNTIIRGDTYLQEQLLRSMEESMLILACVASICVKSAKLVGVMFYIFFEFVVHSGKCRY